MTCYHPPPDLPLRKWEERNTTNSRGFTLLELLVVVAVGVLLVALVPPLLSGIGGTSELRGAARQLAAGFRATRNEAVTRQREAVLAMDLERHRFSITGNPREFALPEGIAVELVTAQSELRGAAAGRIRFFPDGSSTGGRIALTRDRRQYLVDVDWLTGRVRVLDGEVR